MSLEYSEFAQNQNNMKIGRASLQSLLLNNVAEIRFRRRSNDPTRPPYRTMLCTNSDNILKGINGQITLNFDPPNQGPKYNPASKNIVITWDILMQEFRAVSMDDCELLNQYPAGEEFWKVFNEKFYPMSAEQKVLYMNA
jgi:hypothetical protein